MAVNGPFPRRTFGLAKYAGGGRLPRPASRVPLTSNITRNISDERVFDAIRAGRRSGLSRQPGINLSFKADTADFNKRIIGTFAPNSDFFRVLARVNAKSIDWLQRRAVTELNKSIQEHGRPKGARTQNLERTIMDPSVHFSNAERFEFFRYSIAAQKAPYFRAIEEGDRSAIGDIRPIEFHANSSNRFIRPNPRRYLRDSLLRGRPAHSNEKLVRFVRIKTAIPAYRYLERTRLAFIGASVYYSFLRGGANELKRISHNGDVKIKASAGKRKK